MDFKNNVTRLLDSQHIEYKVFTFDYDAGVHSAVEVAAVIGLPAQQVFKTLVVLAEQANHKPMLVVIPGPDTLDLKTLAKAVGVKKAKMASHQQAETLTGLQTGGISPLALIHKGFDIYLDQQAQNFDAIAISAGQRGANILIGVSDLIKLARARMVRL